MEKIDYDNALSVLSENELNAMLPGFKNMPVILYNSLWGVVVSNNAVLLQLLPIDNCAVEEDVACRDIITTIIAANLQPIGTMKKIRTTFDNELAIGGYTIKGVVYQFGKKLS